jgi:hypothetical protein
MYLPSLPTFSQEERGLIGRWKAYIKFEEGNPLVLEDDDKATYITRVQSVYRKAVIRMRYHPEFWFVHRSISPTSLMMESPGSWRMFGLPASARTMKHCQS